MIRIRSVAFHCVALRSSVRSRVGLLRIVLVLCFGGEENGRLFRGGVQKGVESKKRGWGGATTRRAHNYDVMQANA